MPEHVQAEKSKATRAEEETGEKQQADLSNPELTEDVEDILDEIDAVLESDAETFVSQYVQKGGQ
jgi:prokaryotic ubiquitin-like protein Pup